MRHLALILLLTASLFGAREWDGTTANYAGASSSICTPPFTVVVFFKVDIDTAELTLFSCGNTVNAHDYRTRVDGDSAGDPVIALSRGPSSCVEQALSSTGITAGQWHVAGATWSSDSDRRIYLDGGGKVTNTNSCVPTTNNTRIGLVENIGGLEDPMDGLIDRVCFWTVALTDDEHAAVARTGSCQGVRPDQLTQLVPMLTTDTTIPNYGRGGVSFSVTGTLPRSTDRYPGADSF